MQKIYLGLNDKDTKQQEITIDQAVEVITKLLKDFKIEGATIIPATGYYTHNDGTIILEQSLIIELLFQDDETIKTIATALKLMFNQESVMTTKIKTATEFI